MVRNQKEDESRQPLAVSKRGAPPIAAFFVLVGFFAGRATNLKFGHCRGSGVRLLRWFGAYKSRLEWRCHAEQAEVDIAIVRGPKMA